MIKLSILFTIACILIASIGTVQAQHIEDSFQYICPIPGSELITKEITIALRHGDTLDTDHFNLDSVAIIEGDTSGLHEYNTVIADDQTTLIIKPRSGFRPNEIVTVTIREQIATITGILCDTGSFSFTISAVTEIPPESNYFWKEHLKELNSSIKTKTEIKPRENMYTGKNISLPLDFPNRTVTTNVCPDPGYIFLGNLYGDNVSKYIMILDNNGYPIYYKKMPSHGLNFTKHPNGLLSYFLYYDHTIHIIDSTYTEVNTYQCENGYGPDTDMHDFQMLDNGHVLIAAYDPQPIDMSQIVPGGSPNAIVTGLVFQELDNDRNVVFQWRSWDHFEITDAASDIALYSNRIDYCHGNTLELDYDGNILISCRNIDECTKINRQTGDIIWRLGGENNEFTFINDTRGFSHQHDLRRQPNGNITLFDNGNLHSQQYSRAIEYEIDEINKTVTLVWEFRNQPDEYASVMGNQQRLPSGKILIGWGADNPNVTEILPNGDKTWEMTFDINTISYRAFRFPWHGVAEIPYLIAENSKYGLYLTFNKFGDSSIVKYNIYVDEHPEPTTLIDSTSNTYLNFYNVLSGHIYYIRVTAVDSQSVESDYSNEAAIKANNENIYLPGDVNGDNNINGSDVTFGVNYFKGGSQPPDSCWNDSTSNWHYCAADVNGDCLFIGSDITYYVAYFHGQNVGPTYCPQTSPFYEE